MFVRSAFNYDGNAVSRETGIVCDVESPEDNRTHQEFKEECDINTIVKRFGLTGELPDNPRAPVSGDFTGVNDYQTALNAVLEADAAFMELPAKVRAEFQNDPQRLMEFIADEGNRSRAVELGLIDAKLPPERTMVQAIDELKAVMQPKV